MKNKLAELGEENLNDGASKVARKKYDTEGISFFFLFSSLGRVAYGESQSTFDQKKLFFLLLLPRKTQKFFDTKNLCTKTLLWVAFFSSPSLRRWRLVEHIFYVFLLHEVHTQFISSAERFSFLLPQQQKTLKHVCLFGLSLITKGKTLHCALATDNTKAFFTILGFAFFFFQLFFYSFSTDTFISALLYLGATGMAERKTNLLYYY